MLVINFLLLRKKSGLFSSLIVLQVQISEFFFNNLQYISTFFDFIYLFGTFSSFCSKNWQGLLLFQYFAVRIRVFYCFKCFAENGVQRIDDSEICCHFKKVSCNKSFGDGADCFFALHKVFIYVFHTFLLTEFHYGAEQFVCHCKVCCKLIIRSIWNFSWQILRLFYIAFSVRRGDCPRMLWQTCLLRLLPQDCGNTWSMR